MHAGRTVNFLSHTVLPHKSGGPSDYGTPHLCGSEEPSLEPSQDWFVAVVIWFVAPRTSIKPNVHAGCSIVAPFSDLRGYMLRKALRRMAQRSMASMPSMASERGKSRRKSRRRQEFHLIP